MKIQLTGIFLFLFSLTGCVKETLDKCPERNVRISIYAEKFQTQSDAATQDVEDKIGQRIHLLRCILYKEDSFFLDTLIENISGVNASLYPIDFGALPWGNYNLLVTGNCATEVMGGDFHQPGGMSLLYPGIDKTEDLFAAQLPFTVDCDCAMQFETKLRRLLGVVRCEINGIPEEVTEIEVLLHNVNSSLGKGGVYSKPVDVSKRIPVVRTRSTLSQSILMGTFPTLTDKPASYELRLYTAGQEQAVFSKVMSEKVDILRNRLTELVTDFSDEEVRFSIRVDTQWDDYVNGGEVEIF